MLIIAVNSKKSRDPPHRGRRRRVNFRKISSRLERRRECFVLPKSTSERTSFFCSLQLTESPSAAVNSPDTNKLAPDPSI